MSSSSAHEVWLAQQNADLHQLLDSAFRQLAQGLGAVTEHAGARVVATKDGAG